MKSIKDYLPEIADFDWGTYRPKKLRYSTAQYTGKGRADVDAKPDGMKYKTPKEKQAMGLLGESAGSMVERMHQMLNKAGVSDDEIRAGVALTATGQHKVAGRLGISVHEVDALINSLRGKMTSDEKKLEDSYGQALSEDERYSYEKDINQNVTVRDAQTGKEAYLQGTQAADLLTKLNGSSDPQDVLASVQPLMEKAMPGDTGFDNEIKGDSGSYNMPWKTAAGQGTMTVFYTVAHGSPSLEIMSVRDAEGNEIDPDEADHHDLMRQAQDFIGHE